MYRLWQSPPKWVVDGGFDFSGNTINFGASRTEQLDLGREDITHGFMLIGRGYTGANTTYRGMSCFVHFTSVANEAQGGAWDLYTQTVKTTNFTVPKRRCYRYSVDSRLSGRGFNPGSGEIYLKRLQIVNSNIELEFTNESPDTNDELIARGRYVCWRPA